MQNISSRILGGVSTIVVSVYLCASLTCGAAAQTAAPSNSPAISAPDAATLKAAREVIVQMQGDRATTLNSMAAPMAGMMQQLGIKEPDRAQVIVQEVVLPTLTAHYDELLDVQARSLASVLAKEDLKAIGTFYASPPGKRFAAAQPQLAQVQMSGMTQWMSGVMPEIQTKVMQAVKAHGWAPGSKTR
ncbi:DUF2059 domain-containing protein [Methylobacterium crusticola]|uniref:DUF2059 domain-containing protein n=1 Tax=Methylobacterium crusticola TaxID=1697972 RepID=UPI001EE38121|nr:DUF2059 domain-containing protein [Methylobacterium crusticola]